VTATGILDDPGAGSAPRVSVSNAPNPTAETATIRVGLPRAARVKIEIYDVRGALVSTIADGSFAPGEHSFPWSVVAGGAGGAGSGVYFARVTVDGAEQVRKITVVR
jgi:flagellar hook assembly protein FlgD